VFSFTSGGGNENVTASGRRGPEVTLLLDTLFMVSFKSAIHTGYLSCAIEKLVIVFGLWVLAEMRLFRRVCVSMRE
jgi:hypothetical protein